MVRIARRVIAGVHESNSITLDCTPGGGKTGAGTLLAQLLLDAGTVDSVLWLVPRLSLAEQVVDAFSTGMGHREGRQLQVVDGQDELFAPDLPHMPVTVGHVTTYQTIASKANYKRFCDALLSRKTLLIADEVQFLNDELDRGWHSKAKSVFDAAAFKLLMSGTLWRTDDKRIPFIEYERRSDGKNYPLCDISYTLRRAVEEQAVLPTEWHVRGAKVNFAYNGVDQTLDLLDDNDEEESRKVRTFLSSDKATFGVIDNMVEDWRDWCKHGYNSRMIVMADDTSEAKKFQRYLHTKHNISCVLATSREESAGRKLRHFRERKHGQCLVTVAMAYVGFDCPDLTHMAYLSAIRAPSWMLQSFARVSRFDANAPIGYDQQHAFIYGPDDERFRQFCAWLRNQIAMGVADRRGGNGERAKPDVIVMPDDFEPLGSELTGMAIESLKRRISPEDEAKLQTFVESCPSSANLPRWRLFEILENAGFFGKKENGVA